MADKELDESAWKAFCAKQGLKETSLLKALGQLARAEKQGPVDVIGALEVVDKHLTALIREHKSSKDIARQLEQMRKAAEGMRRQAGEDQKAQAADADEDGDSPALLTTKMVPLVRQLRTSDEPMYSLIGLAGKATAVLIMKRPISPSRRKVLAEALDAKAGAKYFPGECLFEQGALTFVLKTQAGGMAKRLKAALLEQTGLRLKVRVRGEDPNDVDEDVEEELQELEGEEPAGAQAPAASATTPPPPPGGPASPAALAYAQRLARLKDRLAQALGGQHPEATRLRAVSGFATEKAAAGDHAAAIKALEMLEKLLAAAPTAAVEAGEAFKARLAALIPKIKDAAAAGHPNAQDARLKASQAGLLAGKRDFDAASTLLDDVEALLEGPGGTSRGDAPASASKGEATGDAAAEATGGALPADLEPARQALREAREALEEASGKADAQVRRLQAAMAINPDPDLREIAGSPDLGLNALTGNFRVRTLAILRDLASAGPDTLPKLLPRARTLVTGFRNHLGTSERVAACDENPLGVPVSLRELLDPALVRLARAVDAFSA